jgi:hypothetical protein
MQVRRYACRVCYAYSMSRRAIFTHITPTALAAALLFLCNDWMLGPLLNPALPTRPSVISEFSALTQPYHWVFQTLDIMAGVVIVLLLPCVMRLLHIQHHAWRWILFGTVALIGADSIVDASLPISCAPSIDTHCSSITETFTLSPHVLESVLVGALAFVAPIMWWFVFRRRHVLLAQASGLFVLLQIGLVPAIVLARHNETEIIGLVQRLYQFGLSAWLTLILVTAVYATQKHRAIKRLAVTEPAPTQQLNTQ